MKTKATHKNTSGIIHRARELRRSGSIVERILWRALREHPEQKNCRFRYQHPLSQYVVDFVCLPARLVLEIDGHSHESCVEQDKKRQRDIEALGYHVLRVSNQDVLSDVNAVLVTAHELAAKRMKRLHGETPPRKSACAFSTLPQGEGDKKSREI